MQTSLWPQLHSLSSGHYLNETKGSLSANIIPKLHICNYFDQYFLNQPILGAQKFRYDKIRRQS